MIVFRITHSKWSANLQSSGIAARWNPKGVYVIYTAATRALACLENLVHRSGEGLNHSFKILEIKIPDSIEIEKVLSARLIAGWMNFENLYYTQQIGHSWIQTNAAAVLQVPSTIIPEESNFIINPNHRDFKKIKLLAVKDFIFDARLKD